MTSTDMGRFLNKLDFRDPDCWLWRPAQAGKYGRFYLDGSVRAAHRVSYEWFVGPIPDGLHIDHLCRDSRCVNPTHLEPVTCAENLRRGLRGELQTHCKHGHEYTLANTDITSQGKKRCRVCHREANRRSKQRKAAE